MDSNADSDIHNRHAAQVSSAASTAVERAQAMSKEENKPAESKTTQKVRDAHYQEDGVRADGTLPAPKQEGVEE